MCPWCPSLFFPLCKEYPCFCYLTLYFTYFVTGILTRGQLGLVDLILQYIHYSEVYEAISILRSMDWDTLGQQCLIGMGTIVNHLLRQRLTPEREGQTWVYCISGFVYTWNTFGVTFKDVWGYVIGDWEMSVVLKLKQYQRIIPKWYYFLYGTCQHRGLLFCLGLCWNSKCHCSKIESNSDFKLWSEVSFILCRQTKDTKPRPYSSLTLNSSISLTWSHSSSYNLLCVCQNGLLPRHPPCYHALELFSWFAPPSACLNCLIFPQ